jgi:ribonuclease HII
MAAVGAANLWRFEKALIETGYARVAGVDEAGRGPLAGPVVAAAVILPPAFPVAGVNDSKQLTALQREQLYALLYADAVAIGIGVVDVVEIERINILQAARMAMAMAVANLMPQPHFLLIDGPFGIPVELPQLPIVNGDARSISVAAASIVAKVTRDRLMHRYHIDYPQFGFDRHKGYATAAHKAAIGCHGPCLIHRRTFKGVCDCLQAVDSAEPGETQDTPDRFNDR